MVHRRPDRVSAYAQTVDVRGLKHPDLGQTMYRLEGGATATLETVWCLPEQHALPDRRTHVDHRHRGDPPRPGHAPEPRIVDGDKLHSPDTTYWPEFDGVRGGALRDELAYFARCGLSGTTPAIGTPEDATAALEATLAAEESARTGEVVRLAP